MRVASAPGPNPPALLPAAGWSWDLLSTAGRGGGAVEQGGRTRGREGQRRPRRSPGTQNREPAARLPAPPRCPQGHRSRRGGRTGRGHGGDCASAPARPGAVPEESPGGLTLASARAIAGRHTGSRDPDLCADTSRSQAGGPAAPRSFRGSPGPGDVRGPPCIPGYSRLKQRVDVQRGQGGGRQARPHVSSRQRLLDAGKDRRGPQGLATRTLRSRTLAAHTRFTAQPTGTGRAGRADRRDFICP